MGIDFGERRVGVAVSDPTGRLATPLTTLTRRAGQRLPLAALERLAREQEVTGVVCGLPLDLAGEETEWSRAVRTAGQSLGARLGLPVAFQDERMTSVRVERSLRGSGLPRHARQDRERVDAAAAALILQLWLDRNAQVGGD
ncbi:MAG: Holliday junction resolvase RuvX [Gemmatimonadota bacterium]